MASICGVCQEAESKYKCPVCELKYCSIDCYKQHKTQHASDAASKIQQEAQAKRDRPGTKHRIPKVDFTGFENDAEFQRLLSRYPFLKTQLGATYGLTLEPGPEDARSWNRHPLFADPSSRGQSFRGRGRGHFRGGRGGNRVVKRGPYEIAPEDRPHGPWTQDKGDKEALAIMKRMRSGVGPEDEKAEGLREFVQLCLMRFGPERDGDVQMEG